MAVSQLTEPPLYSPVYNAIEYKFTSTNVANCDFVFIADLYVNGNFAVRLKSVPQETTNYGIFRLERVLQDYLTFDFDPTLAAFRENDNSFLSYYLEVRERYNSSSTCTGSVTLSAVLDTTAEKYAFNGAESFLDMPSYTATKYVTGAVTRKFLTNSPSRIKIPATDNFNLSFINNPSAPATTVCIHSFDRFNNQIETGIITIPYNPSLDTVHESVGVGPAQLAAASYASGRGYHSNVHWYQVWLRDSSDNRITEIKEFEVDNRCPLKYAYRLWWLNRLGGFDSIAVPLRHTRSVPVSRTTFEKRLPTGHTLLDRGESVIEVNARGNLVFNTNWITEDEARWLEELFTSPEVYLALPAQTSPVTYNISGIQYNAGTVDFDINDNIVLPSGTTFTYEVDDASALGAANSGTGTISGFSDPYHNTNVPATDNVGAAAVGYMVANIVTRAAHRIPVVISSSNYEQKDTQIKYTIECRPSYRENIQSL